jgi:hypothetical protein
MPAPVHGYACAVLRPDPPRPQRLAPPAPSQIEATDENLAADCALGRLDSPTARAEVYSGELQAGGRLHSL